MDIQLLNQKRIPVQPTFDPTKRYPDDSLFIATSARALGADNIIWGLRRAA